MPSVLISLGYKDLRSYASYVKSWLGYKFLSFFPPRLDTAFSRLSRTTFGNRAPFSFTSVVFQPIPENFLHLSVGSFLSSIFIGLFEPLFVLT